MVGGTVLHGRPPGTPPPPLASEAATPATVHLQGTMQWYTLAPVSTVEKSGKMNLSRVT